MSDYEDALRWRKALELNPIALASIAWSVPLACDIDSYGFAELHDYVNACMDAAIVGDACPVRGKNAH